MASTGKSVRGRTTSYDPRIDQEVGYSPILYNTNTGYAPSGPTEQAYLEAAADDGSGDYTGGGGGGGALPYDYTTDPVYAAYVAQLDLDQAQRQAETARRREYLMADQTRMLDETAREGEQGREGISGAYESRGLFNSGARLRDISRQQANQASREGNIREGVTRGVSDLETTLANYLAQSQLKRQQAQLGVFG